METSAGNEVVDLGNGVVGIVLAGREDPPLVARIDRADLSLVEHLRWYPWKATNTTYAWTPDNLSGSPRLHRRIMGNSAPTVDHKDHDGLNNTRRNLRFATRSQNCCNSRIRRNNTSGYIGVSWNKSDKKWVARIRKQDRAIHLGSFDDPIEAALARDKAAREHHGDYAVLNFPEFTPTSEGGTCTTDT